MLSKPKGTSVFVPRAPISSLESRSPAAARVSASTSSLARVAAPASLLFAARPSVEKPEDVPAAVVVADAPVLSTQTKIENAFKGIFGSSAVRSSNLVDKARLLLLLWTMYNYVNTGDSSEFLDNNGDEHLFVKGPSLAELQNFLASKKSEPVSFEVPQLDESIKEEAEKYGIWPRLEKQFVRLQREPYRFSNKGKNGKKCSAVSFLMTTVHKKKVNLCENALKREYEIVNDTPNQGKESADVSLGNRLVPIGGVSVDHCDPWSAISKRMQAYNDFLNKNFPASVQRYMAELHQEHFAPYFVVSPCGQNVFCSAYLAMCLYNHQDNLSYLVCRENSRKNNRFFEVWLSAASTNNVLWNHIRETIAKHAGLSPEGIAQKPKAFCKAFSERLLDKTGFIWRYKSSQASEPQGFGAFMRSLITKLQMPKKGYLNMNRSQDMCAKLGVLMEELRAQPLTKEERIEIDKAYSDYQSKIGQGILTKFTRRQVVLALQLALVKSRRQQDPATMKLWEGPEFDMSDGDTDNDNVSSKDLAVFRSGQKAFRGFKAVFAELERLGRMPPRSAPSLAR